MTMTRWYPTCLALPDGKTLILSGTDLDRGISHTQKTSLDGVQMPEVYDYASNTLKNVTLMPATNWYGYFPFMHVAPNGYLFNAGAYQETKFMKLTDNGSTYTGTISNISNRYYPDFRDYGTTVVYDNKVLVLGGKAASDSALYVNNKPYSSLCQASNTVEFIDLSNVTTPTFTTPAWQPASVMNNQRRHLNAVILPDGNVFVSGGTKWYNFDPGSNEESIGWTDFSLKKIGASTDLAAKVCYTAYADGRIELFTIGTNGNIYRAEQTSINSNFSSLQLLNSVPNGASDISVKRHKDGSADVFVIQKITNNIWKNHYTASTGLWSGFSLFGSLSDKARDIALAAFPDGRLDIYFADISNGNIWHNKQTSVNGQWTGYQLVGQLANKALRIDAIRHYDGSADVVMIGLYNNMEHIHSSPGTEIWSVFSLVGSSANKATSISLLSFPDKHLALYMGGMEGNMWYNEQRLQNGIFIWNNFKLVGNLGNKAKDISVVRRVDAYTDIVMAGLDNVLWRAWSFGPVYQPEMYNPSTNKWSIMANMTIPRMYHSTALLLPDGRVVTAGGGQGGAQLYGSEDHPDAQIFSPPYLFKGERPVISSFPTTVNYNTSFAVSYNSASQIQKVTLIRLGSVTHSYNFNQRFLTLSFSTSGGTINITSPANANLAPPGHYMLFILNSNGVPSVGKIIQIYDVSNPPQMRTGFDQDLNKFVEDISADSTQLKMMSNKDVSIYPNPANEKLFILVKGKLQSTTLNIYFYSKDSKLALEKSFEVICKSGKGEACTCPVSFETDITNLSPDLYLVRITDGNKIIFTGKIIKQ